MNTDELLSRDDIPEDARSAIAAHIADLERGYSETQRELRFYRAVTDACNVGVCVVEPEGQIVFANRRAETMLGITGKRMGERTYHDPEWRISAADGGEFPHDQHPVAQVLATEKPVFDVRFAVERPDGQRAQLSVNAAPLHDDDGNLEAVVTAFVDVADKMEIDRELYENRYLGESLIETAPVIVLVLDNSGRIVRYNPYLEKLSGYALEEVRGADWFGAFLPEADHSRMRRVFIKAKEDEPTNGTRSEIVTKDGRRVLVEWYNKSLKDPDGATVAVLSIGREVGDE